MIEGFNPSTGQILNLLGLSRGDFGWYRDVYIQDGYIVVHTRCGGGNREDYEDMFDEVSDHAWYSHDEDCDFDSNYADIYFKIPDNDAKSFAGLLDAGTPPAEKWEAVLKALKQ
jgi:hypothetical protein